MGLEFNDNSTENFKKIIQGFVQDARNGNALAISNLGYFYLHGIGLKKNVRKAKQLFQKASKLNCSLGRHALRLYFKKR